MNITLIVAMSTIKFLNITLCVFDTLKPQKSLRPQINGWNSDADAQS